MMVPNRGLVMEVRKRSCVVLTGDGQFLEVSKPRGGAEVGREIVFSRPFLCRFKTAYLAVASLMVAVLAWWAFNAMLPRAVAYVALDINPSLELGINAEREIISARGVNDDGKEFLQRVNVVHEPLAEGVQKIIAGCIEYKYINPGQENLVLATVTDAKQNKAVNDNKKSMEIKEVHDCVYTSINNSINESGVAAELIIADTDLDTMEKARDNGVTPGRYLIKEEAQKYGVQITDQELREERIRELEVKKNFRTGDLIQKHSKADDSNRDIKIDREPYTPSRGIQNVPRDWEEHIRDLEVKKNFRSRGSVLFDNKEFKRPVSLSPEEDSDKSNQAERNFNSDDKNDRSFYTPSRGKQYVPRDNEGSRDKQVKNMQNETESNQRDKLLEKEKHKQNGATRDVRSKTDAEVYRNKENKINLVYPIQYIH